MSRTFLFVALLALVLAFGLFYMVRARSGAPPVNLVLITVDTLRHDRLGYAGYEREQTPHLDRLAAEGLVFTRAYSQTGWTLPSMATMFTGHYPRDHGANDVHLGMEASLPTLASILREEGYRTQGYVSQLLLDTEYGFGKGFLVYDTDILDAATSEEAITSSTVTDRALAGLRGVSEPYFLWVHYFDPHFGYMSHEDWAEFGEGEADRYDQEIAYTDREIGRLLEGLPGRERTLIVFTSDHGEEFGEHGGRFHFTTYEEVLRVPLVISGPGLEPGVRTLPAEQIDLLPTILSFLGLETPAECPGKDLLDGDAAPSPVFVYRERPPGFRQAAILDGTLKLIFIQERDVSHLPADIRKEPFEVTNVEPGIELYDLATDPGETRNLGEEDPRVERLAGMLRDHFRAPRRSREVAISEETRERLRGLGYMN